MQECHDIFVRAHVPFPSKQKWLRNLPAKWPKVALIFDTETTLDPTQKLTFGCFRCCQLIGRTYRCIEEGLFHADAATASDLKVLRQYVENPTNIPETERLPPQIKLRLMSRTLFVNRVFWRAVRSGDLVVGFNLPFDLSRLAVKYANARKGGWSLVLTSERAENRRETESRTTSHRHHVLKQQNGFYQAEQQPPSRRMAERTALS